MGKGYYVGLDMGTGSVGWAVTDESYQIFRRHGKAMWGVRLFESAKTAEERRLEKGLQIQVCPIMKSLLII